MSNQEIKDICDKYGIRNYTINDGVVDVDGDVDITSMGLWKLPVKFGKVSGNFECYQNYLTSLDGSPSHVGKNFGCGNNKLTSLKGCPQIVNLHFNFFNNEISDFVGGPMEVGSLGCGKNPISSLDGIPKIKETFSCDYTYLGYIFKKVNRDFISLFIRCKVLNGKEVDLKRLKYVMEIFNMPINLEKIKKYYEINE